MMTKDELITEIQRVREYSNNIIQNIDVSDWFCQPEHVTHVAWQVGHLAVAEYGLGLKRILDETQEHRSLLPESYFTLFGKGSVPRSEPAAYPAPHRILDALNAVHRAVLENLKQISDAQLDQPAEGTHPMFTDKRGCLRWLMQHEFSHAGQLGLLRRQLGHTPLW